MIEGITNRSISVGQLTPHPRNYRQHPEAQMTDLVASHQRFGQFRSVIVWQRSDSSYTIVAGHGIVEAMKTDGVTEIRADVLPPETPQDVIDGIMIADNELSMKAIDDTLSLATLLEEQKNAGYDLRSLGTDENSLQQLLDKLTDATLNQNDEDEDIEPDEEAPTRCKLGDIWQLGRHRIACMDSTDAPAIQAFIGETHINMVWSDPPYGLAIVTNGFVGGGEVYDIPFGGVKNRDKALHSIGSAGPFGGKHSIGSRNPPGSKNNLRIAPNIGVGKYAPIIGDDTIDTAIASYNLASELCPDAIHIWWGANFYAHALPPSSCWIVWDKENTGNFADAELAWCNDKSAVRIFKHMWNGMLKASEQGIKRVHPTQKPIAMAIWAYEKYGHEGDIIYDPFLGSGMSVIAAERTGRSVYGSELSPEYIDVVVKRWETETGQTATLLS